MANIQPCFENLIGLRGYCDDDIPKSGLYINDLGISVNELDEFVTEDFSSGGELFDAQYNLAVNHVVSTINTFFQDRYKAFTLAENRRIGFYQESNQLFAGDNVLSGVVIELENTTSYFTFNLSSINMFTDINGIINVYVYELTNGTLLDIIPITSTPNTLLTSFPHKQYHFDSVDGSLFIGYDTSASQYKGTRLTQSAGCAGCNKQNAYSNQFMSAIGGTLPLVGDKTRVNIGSLQGTAGMSITYSLNCNHQSWLCSISNLISLPILYKTASLIVEYGTFITPNEVITNRSTMNRDLLKERQAMYEQKYTDTMNSILQNIDIPSDERCFKCRQKSRTAIMLP